MRPKKQGPVIFQYSDYRKYLKDLFEFRRKLNRQFTHRFFSKKAGFGSPSILKEVADGKKNLTDQSARQFAVGFDLNKAETEFFLHLVLFNQAGSEGEKNKAYQLLSKFQQVRHGRVLTASQYRYYSDWFNGAIRELAGLPGFKEDPEWIAGRLTPSITPAEAKRSVELLVELGLLIRQADGTLKQESPKLEVDPDVTTLSIRNFNRSMIELGKEAIERFPQGEREVSGLTLGVSKECAREIKEMVREFKKKILDVAVADVRPAEGVHQLNFQFFPLTREEAVEGEERKP